MEFQEKEGRKVAKKKKAAKPRGTKTVRWSWKLGPTTPGNPDPDTLEWAANHLAGCLNAYSAAKYKRGTEKLYERGVRDSVGILRRKAATARVPKHIVEAEDKRILADLKRQANNAAKLETRRGWPLLERRKSGSRRAS